MGTHAHTTRATRKGPPPPRKHRILIVDDEPAILFAYQKLIERAGYVVDLCESPDQSFTLLKKRSYFVVIADMRFGGTDNEDGMKILNFIREKRPDTGVIMISGCGDNSIKHAGNNPWVSFYFEKPVQPVEILKALKTLSER